MVLLVVSLSACEWILAKSYASESECLQKNYNEPCYYDTKRSKWYVCQDPKDMVRAGDSEYIVPCCCSARCHDESGDGYKTMCSEGDYVTQDNFVQKCGMSESDYIDLYCPNDDDSAQEWQ